MERYVTPLPPPGVRIEGFAAAVRDDVGYREAAVVPEALVLSRRWFTGDAVAWAIGAAVALAAAHGFLRSAERSFLSGDRSLAALAAAMVASWCVWRSLADGFNRTTVTAREGSLTIAHGPFSLTRGARVDLADCVGVRVRIHTMQRRRGVITAYGLVLRTRDAGDVAVIADTAAMEHVNFIAWVLTRRVGIAALATERRG